MQYSARNMSGRPDSMVYLAMASKDDLVRANNHAYILLESEKHVLLARLEAQQYDLIILYAYMRLTWIDYL